MPLAVRETGGIHYTQAATPKKVVIQHTLNNQISLVLCGFGPALYSAEQMEEDGSLSCLSGRKKRLKLKGPQSG